MSLNYSYGIYVQVVTLEGRIICQTLSMLSYVNDIIVLSAIFIPFILLIAKSELCCHNVAQPPFYFIFWNKLYSCWVKMSSINFKFIIIGDPFIYAEGT